jgi:hypothetical protein
VQYPPTAPPSSLSFPYSILLSIQVWGSQFADFSKNKKIPAKNRQNNNLLIVVFLFPVLLLGKIVALILRMFGSLL